MQQDQEHRLLWLDAPPAEPWDSTPWQREWPQQATEMPATRSTTSSVADKDPNCPSERTVSHSFRRSTRAHKCETGLGRIQSAPNPRDTFRTPQYVADLRSRCLRLGTQLFAVNSGAGSSDCLQLRANGLNSTEQVCLHGSFFHAGHGGYFQQVHVLNESKQEYSALPFGHAGNGGPDRFHLFARQDHGFGRPLQVGDPMAYVSKIQTSAQRAPPKF